MKKLFISSIGTINKKMVTINKLKPKVFKDIIIQLNNIHKPHNDRLSGYLNRSLENWNKINN